MFARVLRSQEARCTFSIMYLLQLMDFGNQNHIYDQYKYTKIYMSIISGKSIIYGLVRSRGSSPSSCIYRKFKYYILN